jgi:hypothetical protein
VGLLLQAAGHGRQAGAKPAPVNAPAGPQLFEDLPETDSLKISEDHPGLDGVALPLGQPE